MKYESPILSVEVLNTEDVLLVSNVKVETEGNLKTVDWSSLA